MLTRLLVNECLIFYVEVLKINILFPSYIGVSWDFLLWHVRKTNPETVRMQCIQCVWR